MVTGESTTSMSTALDCGGHVNDHNHGGEEPLEFPPQDDQAANDPAVPGPIPIGDDVGETASIVELVPEVEKPDRPVIPPGHEQDQEALKESVNRIVGATQLAHYVSATLL